MNEELKLNRHRGGEGKVECSICGGECESVGSGVMHGCTIFML